MFRKNKINLIWVFFFPIVAFAPMALSLWFAKALLNFFTFGSSLFLVFIVISFCLPRANGVIGGKEAVIQWHRLKWFCWVVAIELGFVALYFLQNMILLHNPLILNLNINQLSIMQQWRSILSPLGYNVGFFPWTFLLVASLSFAILSVKHDTFFPWSTFVPKFKSLFITTMFKKFIDLFMIIGIRGVILFNIILLAVQCGYWAAKISISNNYLLNSMVITSIFFMFVAGKQFQKLLCKLEKHRMAQGWHFVMMWAILSLVVWLSVLMITALMQRFSHVIPNVSVVQIFPRMSGRVIWTLWNWEWWIVLLPFLSSLLIHVSRGRTFRHFIMVASVFPLALNGVLWSLPKASIASLWQSNLSGYSLMAIAVVFLVMLFRWKQSETYLWLGYVPMKSFAKPRRLSPDAFWGLAVTLIALILGAGLIGLQLLLITLAIGIFLIVLLNGLRFSNKN